MLGTFISDYKQWYQKPFSADMSVTGYLLFFGLILVGFFAWSLVLREIVGTIKGR